MGARYPHRWGLAVGERLAASVRTSETVIPPHIDNRSMCNSFGHRRGSVTDVNLTTCDVVILQMHQACYRAPLEERETPDAFSCPIPCSPALPPKAFPFKMGGAYEGADRVEDWKTILGAIINESGVDRVAYALSIHRAPRQFPLFDPQY